MHAPRRTSLDDHNRALGVEHLKGERLYAADPNASTAAGEVRIIACDGDARRRRIQYAAAADAVRRRRS
jgi:hypothetical protein